MSGPESSYPERAQETTGRTVVGIFRSHEAAGDAVRALRAAGFMDDQIGVAVQQGTGVQREGEGSGAPASEGAATGAVTGGLLGGLIGLLGSLLVPGLGPLVVGGVLASTVAGAGIGAATGGLIGALVSMGVPEDDARHFHLGLQAGGTLVTVDAGIRTVEALDILELHGMDLGPSGRRRFETERRLRLDPAYSGPERRLAGV